MMIAVLVLTDAALCLLDFRLMQKPLKTGEKVLYWALAVLALCSVIPAALSGQSDTIGVSLSGILSLYAD